MIDLKNSVYGLVLSLPHFSGYVWLETVDNGKLQNVVDGPISLASLYAFL
jgi:hypothetical protein